MDPSPAPTAPPPAGFLNRHRTTILTVALLAYAIALTVAVADDVLHLGWFPTDLERRARALIGQLDAPDQATRHKAADALVREMDSFVGVPELIRALGSPSAPRRAAAIECLRRITNTRHDYVPDAPPKARRQAIARWRAWWAKSKYRY